ncbi:MAG: DHH family phosphoesterase [Patescibacteria group bacterium]
MPLSVEQEALAQIKRARQILVLGKEHADTDTICSAIAVGLVLQKLGKTFDVVIPGFDQRRRPAFLSSSIEIRSQAEAMRALHLIVDVKDVPLSELMYTVHDNKLEIILLPKHGQWSPAQVEAKHGAMYYDLIILLGCEHAKSLGEETKHILEALQETPVINIDHRPSNEHYGHINLVDITHSSMTEHLGHIIEQWDASMIDTEMATALLGGMMARTKSFRTGNISPKALALSSRLVERGAHREQIVTQLWRTREVSALKLWGRALSRLEQDPSHGLVWTTITETDLIDTQTEPKDLEGVVDELISYIPDAKLIAVLLQRGASAVTFLHAQAPLSAVDIARNMGGTGTRERAVFTYREAVTFQTATTQVIARMKEHLPTITR